MKSLLLHCGNDGRFPGQGQPVEQFPPAFPPGHLGRAQAPSGVSDVLPAAPLLTGPSLPGPVPAFACCGRPFFRFCLVLCRLCGIACKVLIEILAESLFFLTTVSAQDSGASSWGRTSSTRVTQTAQPLLPLNEFLHSVPA